MERQMAQPTQGRTRSRIVSLLLILPAAMIIVASLWPLTDLYLYMVAMLGGGIVLLSLFWFRSILHLLLATTTIGVLLSVAISQWPIQVAFRWNQTALERTSQAIRRGESLKTPCWIGTFRIEKVGMQQGVVCLWTNASPAGETGLIHTETAAETIFNTRSHLRLSPTWQFISID